MTAARKHPRTPIQPAQISPIDFPPTHASTIPVPAPNPPTTAASAPYATLQAEIEALRHALEVLQAEVATIRAAVLPTGATAPAAATKLPPTLAAPVTQVPPALLEGDPKHTGGLASRRSLLKWGGLGAAAAVAAAGGSALTSQTAHAADNANLVLGSQANSAEHVTKLDYDGTEVNPVAFHVNNTVVGVTGAILATAGYNAVAAFAGPDAGSINAPQPYAPKAIPSSGMGPSAIGIQGVASGATSVGVIGSSDDGWGIWGESATGIDVACFGTGRLHQVPNTIVGAPTSGSYFQGEQIRDQNGDLFICTVGGAPGTWLKVATGVPGVSGAISFLANPIRLLDTRTGLGTSGAGTWNAGSTHTLQVTGVVISGVSVPSGAIGVVGNLTVVTPSAGGDLRVYPGPTAPSTSTINFATGQNVANGVTARLNESGQFLIRVDMPTGTHTHVLFDASGYIL